MTCPMPKGEPCAECGGTWLCLKGARKQRAKLFESPPPVKPKVGVPRRITVRVHVAPAEYQPPTAKGE